MPRSDAELQEVESRAIRAMRDADFAGAINAYEELSRVEPNVAQFRANLCIADYSARRYDEAVTACRAALKLNPHLLPPHYFLALSLAEDGQCGEALPKLASAFHEVRELPMKRQLGLDGANCAMNAEATGQATDFTNALVELFPDDPDILYTASHVYSDLATRFSDRLLRVAPGSYRTFEFNAESLEYQGKLKDAAAEYRKVLELEPDAPGIHYRLGKLLLQMGDDNATLAQAQQEFENELRVDPGNSLAEFELGQMAWRARDWNKAVQHLRHAAALDPQSVPILLALGRALVSAGDVQAALEPLGKAVKLAPKDAVAHYQLAIALLHAGRKAEADQQMALYQRIQKADQAKQQAVRRGLQIGGP